MTHEDKSVFYLYIFNKFVVNLSEEELKEVYDLLIEIQTRKK